MNLGGGALEREIGSKLNDGKPELPSIREV